MVTISSSSNGTSTIIWLVMLTVICLAKDSLQMTLFNRTVIDGISASAACKTALMTDMACDKNIMWNAHPAVNLTEITNYCNPTGVCQTTVQNFLTNVKTSCAPLNQTVKRGITIANLLSRVSASAQMSCSKSENNTWCLLDLANVTRTFRGAKTLGEYPPSVICSKCFLGLHYMMASFDGTHANQFRMLTSTMCNRTEAYKMLNSMNYRDYSGLPLPELDPLLVDTSIRANLNQTIVAPPTTTAPVSSKPATSTSPPTPAPSPSTGCPAANGYPASPINTRPTAPCPLSQVTGTMTAYCQSNGQWGPSDYSNCRYPCSATNTVWPGDTCSSISTKNGIVDYRQLETMNLGLACDKTPLAVNQTLCVRPCIRSVTIQSGDTCTTIAQREQKPTYTYLETLNPGIKCSNQLTAGRPLCVQTCVKTTWAQSGEGCYQMATRVGLSLAQIQALNPSKNCNLVYLNEAWCIQSS